MMKRSYKLLTVAAIWLGIVSFAGIFATVESETFTVKARTATNHNGIAKLTPYQLDVGEDSTHAAVVARTQTDTSIVYDCSFWENVSLQFRFAPHAACSLYVLAGDTGTAPDTAWDLTPHYVKTGTADSGAVKIYLQQSNDSTHWTITDSASSTDTAWAFKALTPAKYPSGRLVATYTAKTDSAGVSASIWVLLTGDSASLWL